LPLDFDLYFLGGSDSTIDENFRFPLP
jgi:hypothetical protein